MRSYRIPIAVALAMLLLAACGESALESAEHDLETHFLAPLDDAGMDLTELTTCRLGGSSGTRAHLTVVMEIGSDRADVAAALSRTVDVIERDRPGSWIIQQDAGRPSTWVGSLEAADGGAVLGLTYNNVELGSDGPGLAWRNICDL